MRIVVTGAGGFLGSYLTKKLIQQNGIYIDNKKHAISSLLLVDARPLPQNYQEYGYVQSAICDLSDTRATEKLFKEPCDVIFHLAAVVSGQAEQEFDLGYKGNVQATLAILNAIRGYARAPRFFMTSSVAVFGDTGAGIVSDRAPRLPLSSYGTQKALCELYVSDYSRKGYCDGRVLRLPTVVVRPGAPNAAASSFVSAIIREPLNKKRTLCPVSEDAQLWIISPNDAIDSMLHMVNLTQRTVSKTRIINPIGRTVCVRDMLEALRKVGGEHALKYIKFKRDTFIETIVLTWPSRFSSKTARALDFPKAKTMVEIVREFYETLL